MSTFLENPKTRRGAILAFIWAAVIFGTSSSVITIRQLSQAVSKLAGGAISEEAFRHFWRVSWWLFVKGWHATEFGLLYALVRLAFPTKRWLPLVLAALYAVSDEAHQIFVPNRGCRASDVCIDCLGILAAWMLFQSSGTWRRRLWHTCGIALLFIAAIFLLSVFPFGLVTLQGLTGGSPTPIGL